jgi:DNA-binding HxlR family transcriptional regulator
MKSDHEEEGAGETMTQVFALLGKRWNGLIIVTLLDGPARFSQIVRLVLGVSERMLSERLTELATAGLVKREVEEGPPVNVRYQAGRGPSSSIRGAGTVGKRPATGICRYVARGLRLVTYATNRDGEWRDC